MQGLVFLTFFKVIEEKPGGDRLDLRHHKFNSRCSKNMGRDATNKNNTFVQLWLLVNEA